MDPADFERRLDHRLKQLRAPRAPHTLVPRVLSAVQAWAERPWYERAWFTWPGAWQVASIAALFLLAVGVAVVLPMGLAAIRGATAASIADLAGDVSAVGQRLSMAANVMEVLWRSILVPVLAYAVALIVLMCLVFVTFAMALNRVVVGGAVHS